ncbi:MAG TPA: M56 family metallopeptidase [Pyrinomonadaceae bacterium]
MKIANQLLLTFVINACWQIALVVLFVSFGGRLLRLSSARVQHALWVSGLLLCFAVPLLTAVVPSLQWPPWEAAPSQSVIRELVDRQHLDQTVAGLNPHAPEMSSKLTLNRTLGFSVLSLFLLVVAYQTLKLIKAWTLTRRIRNSAFKADRKANVDVILDRCRHSMPARLDRSVEVLFSESVPVPLTLGLFRPKIILPASLLEQVSDELLISAIGHEFVHVARRDYLLNLIYELLYLPISFHPAAAFMRRRVKQTRELRCDELVASEIVKPEVYARSLVVLAGSASSTSRLSPITTVGIADADILETRIMSLLKKSEPNNRWKRIALLVSVVLLVVPCVAAASLAMRFDVAPDLSSVSQDPVKQSKERAEREQTERMRVPFDEREMKARMDSDPQYREEVMRKREVEMEMRAIKQGVLVKLARINMDQAIQIATSQYPGKVLQCSLDAEKWEEPGKLAADGVVFYRVVVANDVPEAGLTHVWVNAVDGSIIKTEKEIPRRMRSSESPA